MRFRRSVRIAKGVRLNFSGSGTSLSIGPRGASVTIGKRGVYGNVGLPGTGLSMRERLDRPAPRRAPTTVPERMPARRPEPVVTEVAIILHLADDGTIEFKDGNGVVLPDHLVKVALVQKKDAITGWLAEHERDCNAELTKVLDIHLGTPSHREHPAFLSEPFATPKPTLPEQVQTTMFTRLFRPGAKKAILVENVRRTQAYRKEVEDWEKAKKEHDWRDEQQILRLIQARISDPQVMEDLLTARIEALDWPYETLASFELHSGGKVALLDVDLPEIEDLPKQQSRVAVGGDRMIRKAITDKQQRLNYARHISGIGLRLIGETFATLPSVTTVMLSGYSQRPNTATGHIEDEYLYSVIVPREQWAEIDFRHLDRVDPVEALGRFKIRRKATVTGIFTPIEPFTLG